MKIAYFPNQIAKNAPPVLEAFLTGCKKLGHSVVADSMNADAAVIWSHLWNGRMRHNQRVWNEYRANNRNVFVLEVGTVKRGTTWRLGLNGVNGSGYFGTDGQDNHRARQLNLVAKPWKQHGNYVLICPQRGDSEQWSNQPPPEVWVENTIKTLKTYTIRPLVIRPHPRYKFSKQLHGVSMHQPLKLPNSYDDYDFESALVNAWAVVNWNSGPGVESIINGVPAFVGASSLAAPVANLNLSQIEHPVRPDRQQWLNDLAYTEWTVDELGTGFPQQRLI